MSEEEKNDTFFLRQGNDGKKLNGSYITFSLMSAEYEAVFTRKTKLVS